MDDITSRLRSGLHNPEAIILAGVTHDQRCLIAADEIERLRSLVSYHEEMNKQADKMRADAMRSCFPGLFPELGASTPSTKERDQG